jgi:hypothetical protein
MAMSWKAEVGINNVPAYQVSGRPFSSASVIYDQVAAREVKFPYVTRWIQVINKSTSVLRVGYSAAGVVGAKTSGHGNKYYFTVDASGSNGYGKSELYETKVSSLWLYGNVAAAGTCDVVAGLTTIARFRTSGSLGLNFSGSGPVAEGV